jgi:hypothetical protein
MKIDKELLLKFETGLDPSHPERSLIPARVLGFGEISSIFFIGEMPGIALKRMPLFNTYEEAASYIEIYKQYCSHLKKAGLDLPADDSQIIEIPGRPVILYLAQEILPSERFGHRLIHRVDQDNLAKLIERVVKSVSAVWSFNVEHKNSIELAIDAQISNWVWLTDSGNERLVYVDTSTPIFRISGNEQLNPELFLKSAPSFLRWFIRWLFLKDVMSRYYEPEKVFTDLAANFYKEQQPELVPVVIESINKHLSHGEKPLTVKNIQKYYQDDKLIWAIFLAFRRFDRWLQTKILRKRYEFILPGKIKR